MSAMHNAPAVNYKLLKIEPAQTNLKWLILSCDYQKYLSERARIKATMRNIGFCDFQTLISNNMLL